MSIVSCHARVSENLLWDLHPNSDLFGAAPQYAGPAEAEFFSMDKEWRALS
jgi:hypothetical protein